MKLHIVGGFLGSGKTTAIIQSALALMRQGQRVGVITNDQGKYLVDTAFFRLESIPAVEVTGGCFCCNYDALDSRLAQLIAESHPDVIFAESVGSCADVVATVVKPLLELGNGDVKPSSFSVFADARLLRRRLLGQEMPFSENIVYIFDKQLEEAGLIVVNKMDLLPADALAELRGLLAERFAEKPILTQTSLTEAGVQTWLARIQEGDLGLPATELEIDYERYGSGEALLAWLDEDVQLWLPEAQGRERLQQVIAELAGAFTRQGAGIGHLKFMVENGQNSAKISIPTLEEPDWEGRIPDLSGEEARLLINARVEMGAEELRGLVQRVLNESGLRYEIRESTAFHPGKPNPTHRISH